MYFGVFLQCDITTFTFTSKIWVLLLNCFGGVVSSRELCLNLAAPSKNVSNCNWVWSRALQEKAWRCFSIPGMNKSFNKKALSCSLLEIMEMQPNGFGDLSKAAGFDEIHINGRTHSLTASCACGLCKRSIPIHSTRLQEDWKESGNVFSALMRVPTHCCEEWSWGMSWAWQRSIETAFHQLHVFCP